MSREMVMTMSLLTLNTIETTTSYTRFNDFFLFFFLSLSLSLSLTIANSISEY